MLVYELKQNTDLVQAQIAMERTTNNMQILADLANGGDLLPIDVKLQEEIEGFPIALGWSSILTAEERRRYQFWMYLRLVELNNDWFQCSAELMSSDVCEKDVRENMRRSLHRFYELKVSFTRSQPDFISEMQEFARLEGLPRIADDGAWQK